MDAKIICPLLNENRAPSLLEEPEQKKCKSLQIPANPRSGKCVHSASKYLLSIHLRRLHDRLLGKKNFVPSLEVVKLESTHVG